MPKRNLRVRDLWHKSASKIRSSQAQIEKQIGTSYNQYFPNGDNSTFLEQKPTTSEESATLVGKSAVLGLFVPETPEAIPAAGESHRFSSDESTLLELETFASLGERSEDSEETLTGNTGVFARRELTILNKSFREQLKSRPRKNWSCRKRVASYSTNFSSVPPDGVHVGSVEVQKHVFATIRPATNNLEVLKLDEIRSKFCNGSASKHVVVRQCTNKFPGIAIPAPESLTYFRYVTGEVPRNVII